MQSRAATTSAKRAVVVGLLASALAACSSSSSDDKGTTAVAASSASAGAGGTTVGLKLLQFIPEAVTVKAGSLVRWRSNEDITHTVTSGTYAGTNSPSGLRTSEKPDGLFDTKLDKSGATASYTFATAGTFSYYCDIHKGMNAKVVVTP